MTEPTFTSDQMLKAAPTASYRQLDHWARRGILSRDGHPQPPTGSGNPRVWSRDQLRLFVGVARLVDLGFMPGPAAALVRPTLDTLGPVEVDGLRISWDDPKLESLR